MDLVASSWSVVSIMIILIILATDPKSSASGNRSEDFVSFFENRTRNQQFIRRLTWSLIGGFYLLTIVMNLAV
jgi:protein translocase SecG subunit